MGLSTDGALQFLADCLRIIVTPSVNMKAALLIYGIIAIAILLVLLVAIMWVLGSAGDEPESSIAGDDEEPLDQWASEPAARVVSEPQNVRGRALSLSIALTALVAVWLVSGYTTSESATCTSCHAEGSKHAAGLVQTDPHARVDCVGCHETGGWLGRYLSAVPTRVLHYALASGRASDPSEYGLVASRACEACHANAIQGRTTTTSRRIRMSHTEVLEASAACTDCHRLSAGTVGAHVVGMRSCTPCHRGGGRAGSACGTCHVDDVTGVASSTPGSRRKVQISAVRCNGCHDQAKQCDSCHGARMPHSDAFKLGGHARAAAIDVWYRGGKRCSRCHTASNHPCTRCHTSLMGRAHGASLATAHSKAEASACNTCHLGRAGIATRDFCDDVCHSEAAVSASAQ